MATGEGHGLGVDSNDDGEHFHLLNEVDAPRSVS